MTSEPIETDGGARVYPFPSVTGGDEGGGAELVGPVEPLDTHYVMDLDDADEAQQAATRAPVYVDVVGRDDDRRPVVPAALRGANLGPTVRRAAGRTGHRVAYHAIRAPWYGLLVALWAPIGAARIVGRQVRWWWMVEQHQLRQEAANTNDSATWLKLDRVVRAVRRWRGMVLAGEAIGLAVAVLLLLALAPRWAQVTAAAAAALLLARAGRPVGKPIVSPAVVAHRFRQLTADIVLRAYYAAGLGNPDKPDQVIRFGGPMARDGEGSRVTVDLPYGKGLDDAIKARKAIASGLDVAISQVYITRDPTSHRRHVLWVADRDPLAVSAGRTPLLALKPTDIWEPAPLGLNERGRLVRVPMLWHSILVGALPRQGKSFTARALALYAALDPYCRLTVFDGKGSPDWRRFALVADRCGFGLSLTRDGNPVDVLLDALNAIKADVQDRYRRLSELPADVCPEGKLTREIARDPRYRMPVHLVVLDEVQEYFDLGDPSKEIASLLVYLVKVAPAAGVIVLCATQRPSGVGGGGQVGQQFISFRDNHAIRFALRTGSWQVSDMVLGSGAYSEGLDASALLPEYKGVGILRSASDESPTVRTFLADALDAERILIAARALRERAGTLTGYAAGETGPGRERRDVLADVLGVFHAGEAHVSWTSIADRLAGQLPEHWTGVTREAISAMCRDLGVESRQGRQASGANLRGPKRAEVEAAMTARQLTQ